MKIKTKNKSLHVKKQVMPSAQVVETHLEKRK